MQMQKIGKTLFIKHLAKKLDLKKAEATKIYLSFFSAVEATLLNKDKVWFKLGDIGNFSIVKKAAKVGVNPQTGAKIQIPSKFAIKFKASKMTKETLIAKK